MPRSVTANATEALLGAIYLDGGLEAAREFILTHLADRIGESLTQRHVRNHNSRLQHLTQRHGLGVPPYEVRSVRGPDHERSFAVCAMVGTRRFEPAEGPSKKIAEQRAARIAYKILEVELDEQGSSADP